MGDLVQWRTTPHTLELYVWEGIDLIVCTKCRAKWTHIPLVSDRCSIYG